MPDIFGDSLAAFNHSARLADMYAWASINFFDYTFQFGPDIILRIIDVILAFFTFYLATYLALGHRPKLQLKDATIFAGIFLMVMLTSYGTTLYGGFSKIHNYLLISIVSLGFLVVFSKDFLGQKLPQKAWFTLLMLVFGFIFGLTSSVTATAFLLCIPVFYLYMRLTKQKIAFKNILFSWRGASILGILIALFVIYVLGPGLADYDTNPIYRTVCDYLPLNVVFTNFDDSIKRIFLHNAFNFGRFLAPLLVLSLPPALYLFVKKFKHQLTKPKFSRQEKNYLIFTLLFIVIHILALSQIYYFTRMVLPIYFVALAALFYLAHKIFTNIKIHIPLAVVEITLMLILICIRTTFAINYLKQVSPVLKRIKNSTEQDLCVKQAEIKSFNLPYIYLGQEDMLVDWAMPQTVYSKTVSFCTE